MKLISYSKINNKEVIRTSKENAINSNGVLLVGKIKPTKNKKKVRQEPSIEDINGPLIRMGVLKIAFPD